MPYWSSSRVGAVPQGTQPPKQKSRKERYNRKKGITMEDLKKQTAIRLAQEQQQGRSGTEFGSTGPDRGVVQGGRQPNYSPANVQTPDSVGYHPHAAAPPPPPPPPMVVPGPPPPDDLYQQHAQQQTHVGMVHPAYPQQHNDHGAALTSLSNNREEPVVSTPVKRSVQKSHSYHQHDVQRSAPRPSKSSMSDTSAKSKLPHGLTVHELKEMTKARLQAEASEKQDPRNSEPLGPVPSVVRASPEYREHHAPSPTAPSPVPNSFSRNSRSPYPDQSYGQVAQDNWSTDSRNDPWENGSVSTQTSDYIASEPPFGVATSFTAGEEHVFNRARSLSASSGFGASHEYRDAASPAMGQPSTSYYDTSPGYPQNRRRAATLSPRAGISHLHEDRLSHLHEDRPVLPGQELPGLPSFSANRPKFAPRGRGGAFLSPEQARYNQDEANRTRTLSAVSLPAMSHTAEEFAVDDAARISQFSALTEDGPKTPVTGLSDVFRETPSDVSAPPGFVGPDLGGVGSVSSFGLGGVESFVEPRSRASTWGNPTPADLFGSSLFRGHHSSSGDVLADDLASILKLSGAQEKDDDKTVKPPPGLM